jgi:Zn-dependent proteases
MGELTLIQKIAVLVLPVLFAITIHEVAHGWMAKQLGDPTAFMLGRLTVNPIKHIDPLGTLLVPLATLMLGGVLFGWAKPVPITQRNLRRPRRDMAIVALAGPGANLVMAMLWGLVIYLGLSLMESTAWVGLPLAYMGAAGVLINSVLLVLNLLPLPPLDGGRVLENLLPPRMSAHYSQLEPYGLILLLALLLTGVLGKILFPMLVLVWQLVPNGMLAASLFLH